MYGLALMLSISTRTTSKNIDEIKKNKVAVCLEIRIPSKKKLKIFTSFFYVIFQNLMLDTRLLRIDLEYQKLFFHTLAQKSLAFL